MEGLARILTRNAQNMVKGLLGKKLGMTRVFQEDGRWIDVTVLEAGPCTVVQRKTRETDGYDAVQLGYDPIKASRCTKPLAGHFAKAKVNPTRRLKEFRIEADSGLNVGDEIRADLFQAGDRVDVVGVSKGKGFAGVHKRHKFGGGPATHGSMFHRRPGAIGQSADPAEVFKGLRLPGRMGGERVTVKNLEVVTVDPEKNLVVVRGAVPGARGGAIVVRKTVKGVR